MKPLRPRPFGFTGLIRPGSPEQKIAFAYPVGGSVTLPFHASVIRMLWHEAQKGDAGRLLARIFHVSGLYVGDNRHAIVERFLTMGVDWLLQVDTDIEFRPELLEQMLRLARDGRKVIAANVPLGTSYPTVAFNLADGEEGVCPMWECLPAMPVDRDVIECDAVATAVIMIHRDVFEGIAARDGQCWFHHLYLPVSAAGTAPRDFLFRSIGEDVSFCVRAKRAGFGVYAARVPGLRHHKSTPYSEDFARASNQGAFAEADAIGELVAEG